MFYSIFFSLFYPKFVSVFYCIFYIFYIPPKPRKASGGSTSAMPSPPPPRQVSEGRAPSTTSPVPLRQALIKALTERLQGIPSYQSLRYGYKGFVTPAKEYALTGDPPWRDYQDPGWHRPLRGNAAQQRDTNVRFAVASNIYNSQENVRQATNKALMIAVPEMYRRAQGDMGPAIYTPTDDPRAFLLGLQRRYGKRTPTEKEEATQ